MKKTKNTKTPKAAAPQVGCTFYGLETEATRQRRARLDNGQNELPENEWENVAHRLLSEYASFSISDAYSLTAVYDIEPATVKSLFSKWTTKLVASGHLKMVNGVYDAPIYQVI